MTEVPISLGRGLRTGILRLMQRAFLKAHWSNVAIISYPVPADLLLPHVPRGCELDTLHGTPFILWWHSTSMMSLSKAGQSRAIERFPR